MRALSLDYSPGSSGRVVLREGDLQVSWNATRSTESLTPFVLYLAERAELLAHPPEGA